MSTDNPNLEKIPPQSLEAEQAALGAMLLELEAIEKASHLLVPEDFYREAHRTIYTGILELFQHRIAVDLISLGEWLRERNELDAIGGTLYLTSIMIQVPTAAGITHYATIIRARSQQRKLIKAADEIITAAYNNSTPPEELRSLAEEKVFEIGTNYGSTKGPRLLQEITRDLVHRAIDNAEATEEDNLPKQRGFCTPWQSLNKILRPICPAQLVVIGARPGMGKTALALNWADYLAQQGIPGVIFSLEMGDEELTLRELVHHMPTYTQEHLDDLELCRRNPQIVAEFARATKKTWQYPIYIDDRAGRTIDAIAMDVRRLQRRCLRDFGCHLGYVMIDFLQLASPPRRVGRSRADEIFAITQGLANISKDENLGVISLSQFTREVESESPYRPDLMKFFLDGGAIEALAHRALYLYRPGAYNDLEVARAFCRDNDMVKAMTKNRAMLDDYARPLRNVLEVGVIKQRSGAPAKKTFLHTDFAHHRITDLEGYEIRGLFGSREDDSNED